MLKNSPTWMSRDRSSTATVSPNAFVTRSRRTSTSDTSYPLDASACMGPERAPDYHPSHPATESRRGQQPLWPCTERTSLKDRSNTPLRRRPGPGLPERYPGKRLEHDPMCQEGRDVRVVVRRGHLHHLHPG